MTATEQLSRILFEFSYLEEMQQTPFKPRAYQLASDTVAALGDDVEATWRRGGRKALEELPSIGASIASKIDEFFRTGTIKEYQALKRRFPVDIWGLAQIEGMGPQHISDLYRYLGIRNIEDLRTAVAAQRIRTMPHWGERSEEKIAKGLQLFEQTRGHSPTAYPTKKKK